VAEVFDRDEAALVAEARTLTADGLKARLWAWHYGALAELERNEPDPDLGPDTDDSTLTITGGFGGRGVVHADLTPEDLALWQEAIAARLDTWRRTGQIDGDDHSYRELAAAAVRDLLADGSTSTRRAQPRPLLIAIARLSELFARAAVATEQREPWTARILGGGPIGQQALRELLERANLSLVVTDDDGEPLHVGRARRLATAAMLRALIARSGGTCEFPGCHAGHHRCHAHHITWWRNGGETSTQNLALLCPHHHRLVHHGWTLSRGPTGHLDFRRPQGRPVPWPPYRQAA
jgi:hypothetical protein